MRRLYRNTKRLWILVCLASIFRYGSAGEAQVLLQDGPVDQVAPAGHSFTVRMKVDSDRPGAARYYWQDFRGKRVSDPVSFTSAAFTTIVAPSGHTGYLGLVLEPATSGLVLPDRQPGESQEYGFALLPPLARAEPHPDPSSPFGMVHADLEDPYLHGWVKTMTWKTTSPRWWAAEMDKRRARGLLELPIVVGAEWDSPDTAPVAEAQLEQLKARIRSYFAAHKGTAHWEVGIEENLRHRYATPWYWANLEAKIRAVREAADEVDPAIQLIYQVAELRPQDAGTFLRSAAARHFDILSLHPYAWPDFPDPEQWLENYLSSINELMIASGRRMPVWFTEVGAPQRGNHRDGFFGYPQKGVEVPGKTAYEAVIYLTKLHILAFHLGVEKIFWYNYKDRKPEREYAENHFGLRDYWGYPKPVYPAYVNLQTQLWDKAAGRGWNLSGTVRVYEFDGREESVTVAWSYPARTQDIAITDLLPGHSVDDIIAIVDPVGSPVPFTKASLRISGEPMFIRTRAKQPGKETNNNKADQNK